MVNVCVCALPRGKPPPRWERPVRGRVRGEGRASGWSWGALPLAAPRGGSSAIVVVSTALAVTARGGQGRRHLLHLRCACVPCGAGGRRAGPGRSTRSRRCWPQSVSCRGGSTGRTCLSGGFPAHCFWSFVAWGGGGWRRGPSDVMPLCGGLKELRASWPRQLRAAVAGRAPLLNAPSLCGQSACACGECMRWWRGTCALARSSPCCCWHLGWQDG